MPAGCAEYSDWEGSDAAESVVIPAAETVVERNPVGELLVARLAESAIEMHHRGNGKSHLGLQRVNYMAVNLIDGNFMCAKLTFSLNLVRFLPP